MKDFGQTIPGHGGVTDRFDCQMIMAMFAYVYYWNYVASTELTVGDALDVSAVQWAGLGWAGPGRAGLLHGKGFGSIERNDSGIDLPCGHMGRPAAVVVGFQEGVGSRYSPCDHLPV